MLSPEQIIVLIQEGDLELRNQFISDYQPYIAKVTSRFSKRYIDPAKDDEYSIALSAFNEAITGFSPHAGRSFLGFAEQVIRRRLIDYVRKEQRFAHQLPYSSFEIEDDEAQVVNPVEIHQAIEVYEKSKESEERKHEILELTQCLNEFGIRFGDLADASPKHDDSRQSLFAIARQLADNRELMRLMLAKRQLPIKELLELVSVSRKTLERNRKFIIAAALIYEGPYPYLKAYLQLKEE